MSKARHRAQVLSTLLGICRSIEKMRITPAAREACREVAGRLAADLAREKKAARRRAAGETGRRNVG
jgi:hypothetical protein